MKKILSKPAVMVILASSLVTGLLSLKPCGPVIDWMTGNQQEVLELQAFAVEGFVCILQSLSDLYVQNPEVFVQFLNLSIQGFNSPIPAELLIPLKTFGLVNDNAQISDLVRLVLDWAVEQNADGSIKIWSLDELIKDGWVRLMLGKKKA